MARSISEIVRQFKSDVAAALAGDTILKICAYLGHRFRKRVLDPVTTVHVFLLQILHGNIACTALSHLAGATFSAAAYCSARGRLPLALFEDLLQYVCDALYPEIQNTGRWRGHRTWHVDGSSFSMPDTPDLQKHFGQPGGQAKGCGFPVAHLLALFHAGTGLLLRVIPAPLRTHDMRHAALLHQELTKNDLIVGDRAFASYGHFALILKQQMHGLFRSHQKQIVDFRVNRKHTEPRRYQKGRPTSRYVERVGPWDQIVDYVKPLQKPKWMDAATWEALPATLRIRELRYVTPQRGYRTQVITLATTLLDAERYPKEALAELYLSRWQIELNFRHLKTTMGMEVLHCQEVAGVLKELHMFAIAYNLVRLVMLEAVRRQNVPLDRISFVDALRWLRFAEPGTPLCDLVVNPSRTGRAEPRVLKRRPKEYNLMNKPRNDLRKAAAGKKVAA